MWFKKSRVVYIDTRWLFIKVLLVILAAAAAYSYWDWTRVTEIDFCSNELEAHWKVSEPETIRKICSGVKKSRTIAGVQPPTNGIRVRFYSKREVREYLWDHTGYLLDKKKGNVIEPDSKLKDYFELAVREIKSRSPFGEIIEWKEVKGLFKIGSRALISDIDTGTVFTVCRTGGHNHADIEPLNREDTIKLRTIYNGTINWKRRAVVVQIGGRKIAASFTGAPHGQGKVADNDLYGKVGLYFSDQEKNSGTTLSHQMMIWKAAGRTRTYLKKMSPEEVIIAMFTAIDQRDLKSLKFILKNPEELKKDALEHIIGVTVTGIRKEPGSIYDVTVSVSLKTGPYNHKKRVRVNLSKDVQQGCYFADNKFLEKIL